jgi:ATP-dependent DNA ligase
LDGPFPRIVASALNPEQESFVIDGEVVVLDKEGKSDFSAVSSGKHDEWAQFYAFDILAGDGEDLRPWPLALRKGTLAGMLSDPVGGIFIAEYEKGEWRGPILRGLQYEARGASSRSASIMAVARAHANIG